jgi:hypothetical protein
MWIYGRFKMYHTDKINDIVFCSLASYGMIQVNSQLSAFFGVDTSKTLETNAHTFDHILNEELNGAARLRPHEIEDEAMEIGDEDIAEGDDEEMADDVAEEVEAAPRENVAATANTVEEARETLDRMIQEIRAADNYTYADYATIFNQARNMTVGGNDIYTIRAQAPQELRAVTLEDIDRVAPVMGNGTRNG